MTHGGPTESGFDGANDMPYEQCTRVQYRPPLEPIRCEFFECPPKWLTDALAE